MNKELLAEQLRKQFWGDRSFDVCTKDWHRVAEWVLEHYVEKPAARFCCRCGGRVEPTRPHSHNCRTYDRGGASKKPVVLMPDGERIPINDQRVLGKANPEEEALFLRVTTVLKEDLEEFLRRRCVALLDDKETALRRRVREVVASEVSVDDIVDRILQLMKDEEAK